jgi:hypothetical protein
VRADLNGDGRADLVAFDAAHLQVRGLTGRGDGTFQPTASFDLAGPLQAAAVGDFDFDRLPDIVVGEGGDPGMFVFGTNPGFLLSL